MPQRFDNDPQKKSDRVFQGRDRDYLSMPSHRDRINSQQPRNTSRQRTRLSDHCRDSSRYTSHRKTSRSTTSQRTHRRNVSHERESREYAAYSNHSQHGKRSPKILIAVLAVFVVLAGVGLFNFVKSLPITVIVNGVEQELSGHKNIETILERGYARPLPGNLVAVDGKTLEKNEGEKLWASVNEEHTTNYKKKLPSNAIVVINNGNDIVEPSEDKIVEVSYETIERGTGPFIVLETEGTKGIKTTKTGKLSGKTVEEETQSKQDRVFRKYFPDVGFEKVVAFTFDDGPWPAHTKEILDVLKENEAKATFFVVGTCIENNGAELVKRASNEGHQIATHTYSHAAGSGGSLNLGKMSTKEQIEEVTKGYAAIEGAIGFEPSHVLRSPGGNYSVKTMDILAPYVDAEIGWTIDSQDWRQPGVDVIFEEMTSVKPGSVVLCHDGGGSRDQTIQALKKALPILKKQGYRFVTIDELLAYPAKP